jgi:hypothetical protein
MLFLAEQGILEECEEQAVKEILADQIKAAMEKERLIPICDASISPVIRRSRQLEQGQTNTEPRAGVASPT